jgi:hypothetical protein
MASFHDGPVPREYLLQQSWRITFPSGAEMLDTFGMQQGGSQYGRLIAAFQHVFGATIFFGIDTHRSISSVVHEARFNFMSEARIWYSRDPGQSNLEAAKALSSSPALDAFTWISYQCFVAKGEERVSLFGKFGLANQLS